MRRPRPHRGPRRKNGHRRPSQPAQTGKTVHAKQPAGIENPIHFEKPVDIEKPIYGGAFLGRLEGKALFVPLALPGERARIHITEERQSYAQAEVDEIVKPSPERVLAPCPYFGACGGCQYQHAGYHSQLAFKLAILRETLQRAGVPVPGEIEVLARDPWGYRNRIRLAVDAHGQPGYRGRASHRVIPIAQCPISAPLLVHAALAGAEILKDLAPGLRATEIALFSNCEESALLASVFTSQPAKVPLSEVAGALKAKVGALEGMELVVAGRPGQPPRTQQMWGERSLSYRAAGFEYRVDHGAFFQVNRWLVDALTERVTAGRAGRIAWDLYSGVGLFARQLAARFEHVAAVESAPSAIDALRQNLHGTSGTPTEASSLDFLRRNCLREPPDLIVVDPPRTGLGAETAALIAEKAAPTLVYVSCDPATLARDLRALVASGYEIERLTLADLFPQSFHLETIVDLRHRRTVAHSAASRQ